jgi:hypothetical protein
MRTSAAAVGYLFVVVGGSPSTRADPRPMQR